MTWSAMKKITFNPQKHILNKSGNTELIRKQINILYQNASWSQKKFQKRHSKGTEGRLERCQTMGGEGD